ncbi:hypothetical protein [Streptomyces hydrogenans]|uniref:hypothetical protein n=1 Tax=Streptomyces hydrogenans TaxID=1873719 RepID=UPI0035D810F1
MSEENIPDPAAAELETLRAELAELRGQAAERAREDAVRAAKLPAEVVDLIPADADVTEWATKFAAAVQAAGLGAGDGGGAGVTDEHQAEREGQQRTSAVEQGSTPPVADVGAQMVQAMSGGMDAFKAFLAQQK